MFNSRWLKCLLLTIIFIFIGSLTMAMAQPDTASKKDLSEFFASLDLPKDQHSKVTQLTKDFLIHLQSSGRELAKLLAPASGDAQPDPKTNEKIAVIQQQFGIKMESYHLDLADVIGDPQAEKAMEVIHSAVPLVLMQGSSIASSSHATHGNASSDTTHTTTSNNMPNMNNMPPNPNRTGDNTINRQILTQLLSYNTMLMQMLTNLSGQNNNGNLQALAQPVYQIIVNQSFLIQLLFTNLSNTSMSMGTGNTNTMGMNGK